VKFEVTLKDLRQAGACYSGYNKVVRALQGKPFTGEDDSRKSYIHRAYKKPISLLFVLESNGLDDAFWTLPCVPEIDRDARFLAVWCARKAQHLMKDPRSINALDVAERFARGEATTSELDAAQAAACEAAQAAAVGAPRVAAWAAAEAAARVAAGAAAWAAARAAAGTAAGTAARAARAAARAAWAAADAGAATRAAQEKQLRIMLAE